MCSFGIIDVLISYKVSNYHTLESALNKLHSKIRTSLRVLGMQKNWSSMANTEKILSFS